MSTWVVGPWSGNRSQRCHSEVMFGVGHRLEPGDEDGLVQVLRVAELGLTLAGGLPSSWTINR